MCFLNLCNVCGLCTGVVGPAMVRGGAEDQSRVSLLGGLTAALHTVAPRSGAREEAVPGAVQPLGGILPPLFPCAVEGEKGAGAAVGGPGPLSLRGAGQHRQRHPVQALCQAGLWQAPTPPGQLQQGREAGTSCGAGAGLGTHHSVHTTGLQASAGLCTPTLPMTQHHPPHLQRPRLAPGVTVLPPSWLPAPSRAGCPLAKGQDGAFSSLDPSCSTPSTLPAQPPHATSVHYQKAVTRVPPCWVALSQGVFAAAMRQPRVAAALGSAPWGKLGGPSSQGGGSWSVPGLWQSKGRQPFSHRSPESPPRVHRAFGHPLCKALLCFCSFISSV